MTPKPISAVEAKRAVAATPLRLVIVTMDSHLASAVERARPGLRRDFPGLQLTLHAASEYAGNDAATARCIADIAAADIIVAGMLFLEDHFLPVLPALQARRDHCDAMICMASAAEVTRLTRLGHFDMSKPASGPMALLKKLRGGGKDKPATGGAAQMKMLRRLPQMLRFIPGTAQDVRAYFITLQYWLGGSDENMLNLVRHVIDRGAAGARHGLRGLVKPVAPVDYPEVGVYHPRMAGRLSADAAALPQPAQVQGTVGVLLLRSYLLSNNAGHYDGVIAALEARGLRVIPAFAAGLDSRPAIDQFFLQDGRPVVDAVVSLTGFSLVGGPAYNDAKAAEDVLATLDVPYVAAHPVEFQTLDQWGGSDRGLLPVESTIMVAIPELDGSTGPIVFGGRPGAAGVTCQGCDHHCTFKATDTAQDMASCPERALMLAARVGKLVALRRSQRAQRKVAVVIFNFPPNAGNIGSAAYLSVFESLFHTLVAMQAQGYSVDLPASVDALRDAVLQGNAQQHGADANVHALIPADDHVRRERWLAEIEAQWGPAPGRQLSNGRAIWVLGRQFGNVLVAVQPSFGYEGDPMRLLFEKGLAPTHAFSAFYRYLREDFAADAVLHFGTHGALEFMPGKQSGMGGHCWPDRLIADLPNIYLYASNNPSEGAIAKRRSGATLISYLTPPIAQAGLYKGLNDLKGSIERWRGLAPLAAERAELALLLQSQAAELNLADAEPLWDATPAGDADARVQRLGDADAGAGIHPDPARPACDRPRAVAGRAHRHAAGHGRRIAWPQPAARDGGSAGGRPGCRPGPAGRWPAPRRRHPGAAAGTGRRRCPAGRRHRGVGPAACAGRWLHPPGARWRHPAHAGGAAHRPQHPRLRPLPHPQRLCSQRRCQAGPAAAGPAPGRGPPGARVHRHGAVGQRQPEERRRANRPGAGADGRAAALRQLRPHCRCHADPAGRPGPPAGGRGDHAVGHLPRPDAAADPPAGRSRLPGRVGRRTAGDELGAQARAGLPARAWLHAGDRRTAGLRQCRRRLRLQRQQPGRKQQVGRRR